MEEGSEETSSYIENES